MILIVPEVSAKVPLKKLVVQPFLMGVNLLLIHVSLHFRLDCQLSRCRRFQSVVSFEPFDAVSVSNHWSNNELINDDIKLNRTRK